MRRRLHWLEVGDGCDSKTWILHVACLNHRVERGHCWLVLEFFGPISIRIRQLCNAFQEREPHVSCSKDSSLFG